MKKIKSSPLLFILMSAALFFYTDCTQNNKQLPTIGTAADTFAAPKVTILANLPDSSQPKVYLLAKMPKPFIKSNPQPPVVYSCIDSITHKPLAPEVQGRGILRPIRRMMVLQRILLYVALWTEWATSGLERWAA